MQKIVERLQQAQVAYYNSNPIMDDAEYDALRDQLEAADPNHPFLKEVGATPSSNWPKAKHAIPMGSQLKITTKEELVAWSSKYTTGNLIWSEKMDGSSIELVYEDGNFVAAVSRGDGYQGDLITQNVALIQNFPKALMIKSRVSVRAEIVMKISTWKSQFPGTANPRNVAAGILRRKENPEDCKYLSIYAFDILIEGPGGFYTKDEKFEFLKSRGFQTPNYGVAVDVNNAQENKDFYETRLREKLDYEIDGLIVEDNDLQHQAEVGEVDNRPKGQRAYKFASLGAYTELLDITWQVGRTGRLSPVGELAPVSIGGVTISRVLLNNYDEIEKFKLGRGAKVFISRRQDVIPKVISSEGSEHIFSPPGMCTSCDGTDIKKIGVDYCCMNEVCPGQTLRAITHYMECLDVKGFGDSYIAKLMDMKIIEDAIDLYRLIPAQIGFIDGLSEKVTLKFLSELRAKSQNVPLKIFVKALGIKLFGEGMAEKVIEGGINTLESLRSATYGDLLAVHGIGEEVAKAAVKGLKEKSEFIEKMLTRVTIAPPAPGTTTGPLSGKAFCFTGYRDKEANKKIESLGGKITSSVTKATTHLVVADLDTLSVKAQKARSTGVTILDPAQLNQMLGGA